MARTAHASAPDGAQPGVWRWALAGAVLGLLGALLLAAPASWVQQAVQAASQGRVLLREVQGSVWQGSAQLVLSGGDDSRGALRLPGRVHWQLRPGLDRLHLSLRADCCTPQPQRLQFLPGLGRWRLQLDAGESTWPAAVLAGLGTPWNTVQLQGPLQLRTPGLTLESAVQRLSLQGAVTLDLPGLQSSLSTLRPLGSYRLHLHAAPGGDQAQLDLSTLQGGLQLQGQGQWTAGRLRFVGEARADAAHEAALSNLLNIMGRRDGARSVITLG